MDIIKKAYALFWEELEAASDHGDPEPDDYDNAEDYMTALSLINGILTTTINESVLNEAYDCLTRDWCCGKVRTAFLRVLADNGRLHVWDEAKESRSIYTGAKPKKLRLDGVVYYKP